MKFKTHEKCQTQMSFIGMLSITAHLYSGHPTAMKPIRVRTYVSIRVHIWRTHTCIAPTNAWCQITRLLVCVCTQVHIHNAPSMVIIAHWRYVCQCVYIGLVEFGTKHFV